MDAPHFLINPSLFGLRIEVQDENSTNLHDLCSFVGIRDFTFGV